MRLPFSIVSMSEEEKKRLTLKKMRHIVATAYHNSKFYRALYDGAGFYPDMLKTYEDIKSIPVAHREALKRASTEEVLTVTNLKGLHSHTTSGSSGVSVKYYYNDRENFLKNYGVLRSYLLMGMKFTDKAVALKDPVDIRKPGLTEKLGILAYDYYNIYDPIEEICARISQKYKTIDLLKGMPSDLVNLCYAIRHKKLQFPSVRQLYTEAEVLDDFTRQYISETLHVEILDWYGSVENGCIAFQVPGSKKYFVNEDQILLENGSGDVECGDAIITNLRNTVFPIIRYQIGDMIEFGNGISDLPDIRLRTIERIHGKYLDFIVLPDGTIISPHVPKQEMTAISGIKRFQIVQKDYDDILIKIEKGDKFSKETEAEVLRKMGDAFGHQVMCRIEYDDRLSEKKDYRKIKVIQSDVAQKFLSAEHN